MLANKDLVVETIAYLENPPSREQLKTLLGQLGLPASTLIRSGDMLFNKHYSDLNLADSDAVLDALCAHPALLQRPIVIKGSRAVIARPPQRIEELLDQ